MPYYTVHNDYFATGEGRTIMVLYVSATSEDEAMDRFRSEFGVFYSYGAVVLPGKVFNFPTCEFLISDRVRKALETWDAHLFYSAEFHYNIS